MMFHSSAARRHLVARSRMLLYPATSDTVVKQQRPRCPHRSIPMDVVRCPRVARNGVGSTCARVCARGTDARTMFLHAGMPAVARTGVGGCGKGRAVFLRLSKKSIQ